jgi:hypothetical protein
MQGRSLGAQDQSSFEVACIRLASLPAVPDLRPLSRRVIKATSLFMAHIPSLLKD